MEYLKNLEGPNGTREETSGAMAAAGLSSCLAPQSIGPDPEFFLEGVLPFLTSEDVLIP